MTAMAVTAGNYLTPAGGGDDDDHDGIERGDL